MDQGSKEKGEDEMAGGSGTVKVEEEEVLYVTDTDSEDDPIVKEEDVGPQPKLLLNRRKINL